MDKANKHIINLSVDQEVQSAKLNQIVEDTTVEKNQVINDFLHPSKDKLTPGQKVSDKIARFGGSWKFIFLFAVFFAGWIVLNIILLSSTTFDPFPFVLMNLILSLIAALQAPVILMSQNRHDEKDRIRDENDYMINLKAETEIRSLNNKMNLLIDEQIKTIFDTQAKQFILLEKIMTKLDILKTI